MQFLIFPLFSYCPLLITLTLTCSLRCCWDKKKRDFNLRIHKVSSYVTLLYTKYIELELDYNKASITIFNDDFLRVIMIQANFNQPYEITMCSQPFLTFFLCIKETLALSFPQHEPIGALLIAKNSWLILQRTTRRAIER